MATPLELQAQAWAWELARRRRAQPVPSSATQGMPETAMGELRRRQPDVAARYEEPGTLPARLITRGLTSAVRTFLPGEGIYRRLTGVSEAESRVRELWMTPHSRVESLAATGADIGGSIAGFVAGPSKFIHAAKKGIAAAPGAMQLLKAVGQARRLPVTEFLRPYAGIALDGAIYTAGITLADPDAREHLMRLANDDPNRAAAILAQRMATTAGEWAVGGAAIKAGAKGASLLFTRARAVVDGLRNRLITPEDLEAVVKRGDIQFARTVISDPVGDVLMESYNPTMVGMGAVRTKPTWFLPVSMVPYEVVQAPHNQQLIQKAIIEEIRMRGTPRAKGINPRAVTEQTYKRAAASGLPAPFEATIRYPDGRTVVVPRGASIPTEGLEQATVRARGGIGGAAGETGALSLNVEAGTFGENLAATINLPASGLIHMPARGVALMSLGFHERGAWEAAMRDSVSQIAPGAWEKLAPQQIDRMHTLATRMWAKHLERAMGREGVVSQFAENWQKGQAGKTWYPGLDEYLRQYFPQMADRQMFLGLLALSSKSSAARGAVATAIKAYTQHRAGLPAESLFFATPDIRKFLQTGQAATPKLGNFLRSMVPDTADEVAVVAQAASQGRVVFTPGENAVVIDIHGARASALTAKEAARLGRRGATEGQKAKIERVSDVPAELYAIESEKRRALATLLSQNAWAELAQQHGGLQNVPIPTLVKARVTPRDLQAMDWTGWKDEVNRIAKSMGWREYTAESYQQIIASSPALQNALKIMTRKIAPAGWSTPEEVAATIQSGRRFAIIGSDPAYGLDPKVARRVKEGENPYPIMLEELTRSGHPAEQIISVRGMWEGGHEPSFILLDNAANPARVIKLAARYGQTAVITNEGLVDVRTGRTGAIRGMRGEANPAGHTMISGRAGDFPITFDFGPATEMHPAWSPLLVGLKHLPTQLAIGSEAGFIRPSRAPETRIRVKFDPRTGKFVPESGALPPALQSYVARIENEFQRDSFRAAVQTGQPLPAGAADISITGNKVSVARLWLDYLTEASVAVKLTNPLTHIRNTSMNAFVAALHPIERLAASGIDAARAAVTGNPREIFAGESRYMMAGYWAAIPDAAHNFVKALRHEMQGGKFEATAHIPGRAGQAIRLPFRFLYAADELFREINRRGNIYAEGFRTATKEGATDRIGRVAELIANPTEAMAARTRKKVSEYLFQEELGDFGQILSKFASLPGGRFILPFVKTPINVAKFFARRTPFGAATAVGQPTAEMEENLARAVVGTAILAGVTMLARNNLFTGAGPTDPKQRELLYAQGWQPYSIRVGDKYISYRGFEPLGAFFSAAAALVESNRADPGEAYAKLQKDAMRLIGDASFITQLDQAFDAALEGPAALEKMGGNIATGMVPRAVGAAAQTIDPVLRDPETITERVMTQIPGLSQKVPAKLDPYGQPIVREGVPFLPRWSTAKEDPLSAELNRLGLGLSKPREVVTRRGEKVTRAREEVYRLAQARGQRYRDILTRIVQSEAYARLPDEDRRRVMQKWIRKVGARDRDSEGD